MMTRPTAPTLVASALLLLLAASGASAGCGGKTSEVGPGGSSGGASSGSGSGSGSSSGGIDSSSSGSSGSSSGGISGSTSGSSSGGVSSSGGCVYVDTSTYDTSCNASTDCIQITAGNICSPSCFCGGATINADGQTRYNAQVASITNEACPCAEIGVPTCANHQCLLCSGGPGDPPGCYAGSDASTGACVNVQASSFDQSCHVASDCVEVATGQLCTGGCRCPDDVISASAQGAYDMAIAPILNGPPPTCFCPSPGIAYCSSQGKCAICPPGMACASGGGDGG
jgi:hypothetical protein